MDTRNVRARRYCRKTKNNQALLRLISDETFNLCSSTNLTAGVPLGSTVRPCSMSLTADGESSISEPISAKVIPALRRRSEMNEANGMAVMPSSLRATVESRQRLPVTGFRKNQRVPRPPEMPKDLRTVGARVRWWREYRKMSRPALAKKVNYSYSGLADLENDESTASEKLHLIAAELRLKAHYLETGLGEPEEAFPQDAAPEADWMFSGIARVRLRNLTKIEKAYIQQKLDEALLEIEAERKSKAG